MVALDYTHASERLRQAPRHLGINFAALTKNRTDGAKSFLQRKPKAKQEAERNHRHQRADPKQYHHSDARRKQATGKLHQARPQ